LRSKPFIAAAAVLAVLILVAGAVVVVDGMHRDRIANGVRVGGIDVGGMKADAARARLRATILAGLNRPITVSYDARSWRLTAHEAQIAANLDATVDKALARSHQGSIVTRAWRDVTGGTMNANLEPTVSFSKAAVIRLLDRVRASVERKPVDADIKLSGDGLNRRPGQDGLRINASKLHAEIRGAVVSPTATRSFVASVASVQPKVTEKDLARQYGTVLIVDRKDFKLTLYKDLKKVKTYGIAVGRIGLETPAGLYHIQNKAENPAWHVPNSAWAGKLAGKVIPGDDPTNPIVARWMGIYDGAGIHGTNEPGSIGSAASHGCIRMRVAEVEQLYDEVPVGAPIYIA
jgi:lipoprotein-anchoring transpeptidase ErfK/SrfK